MTRQELSQIIFFLRAIYPRHYDKFTKADYDAMVDAWGLMLDGYSYEKVFAGTKAFVATDKSGFPPSVGQILDCIRVASSNPAEQITSAEAWDQVYKAVCNLRWDEPEKEFNKLPEVSRKVIGTAANLREIAMMDTDSVMIGEKARFMRMYDAYKEQEKDYLKIPQSVRQRLATLYDRAGIESHGQSLLEGE